MNQHIATAMFLLVCFLILTGCNSGPNVTQMPRDQDMERRVKTEVLDKVGLTVSIRVVIDNRQDVNLYATEYGPQWYIGFNEGFFNTLNRAEQIGAHAHEVGHLLYRHVGKPQEYEVELSPDRFAGYILQRNGFTLSEATSLWSKLGERPSPTHPASRFRVEQVAEGWQMAETQDRTMLNTLRQKIRDLETAMAQQASQVAELTTEKDKLGKQVQDALAGKRWAWGAAVALALFGLAAGWFIRQASLGMQERSPPSGTLTSRIRHCFGSHTHDNPLCARAWKVFEPLLTQYAGDDAGLRRAVENTLDLMNTASPLSVADRKAVLRILLAA